MRLVAIGLLAAGLCGCSRSPPSLAGGKPTAHWVQALHGPDVQQRRKAVEKLGNVGPADPAALPAVLGALQDPSASVRGEAVLALMKFGPAAKSALPALAELSQRDRDAQVRAAAARALEQLQ
jgi:HEAT repeat protein